MKRILPPDLLEDLLVAFIIGLGLFAACQSAHAQAPANTVLVCSEICSINSTTGTSVVYQFGAGAKFNTITAPKYPLLVDCNVACPQMGGDPDVGNPKAIYAVQQASAYTVTVAGVATPVTVPALPVVVVTPPVNPPPPARTLLGSNFTCTNISIWSDSTVTVLAANCTPTISMVTP